MINISGLSKAAVLAALWNNSKMQGMSFLANDGSDSMTEEEAAKYLKEQTYFDYLNGRVLKINLSSDEEFDPYLYDRDLGEGAAQEVVDKLRGL